MALADLLNAPMVLTLKAKEGFEDDNPYEVGADRIANAVAAYERVQATCVVVDFGTAITYDAVSSAGEYLGGIISPGAEISIDALYERAAKLPKVELAQPRDIVLIAGKGHEPYQVLRDRVIDFDDREVARSVLKGFGYGE